MFYLVFLDKTEPEVLLPILQNDAFVNWVTVVKYIILKHIVLRVFVRLSLNFSGRSDLINQTRLQKCI